MCDRQNDVQYIWQLLSQFVSWEFCRYTGEENETSSPETDVLTFLRNMIVKRTEKSISDITKHEIVAKFIMEAKAIQDITRMTCISVLSESVKKICPELEAAVNKLVHHLETFLNVLESTDESRKALIQLRINDAIYDFSKEAERLLPPPDLLKVVESWTHHHGPGPKSTKKVIYDTAKFEKVLENFHHDNITPSEAKLIAVALYEDKKFERILLNAEADSFETEAESEMFSLSLQSSQANEYNFSHEFGKNLEMQRPAKADLLKPQSSTSPVPNRNLEISDDMYGEPPHLSPFTILTAKSPIRPSQVNPLVLEDISSKTNGNKSLQNETERNVQFAQSSGNESPAGQSDDLYDRIHAKFEMINQLRTQNQSDSDTSDCDKHPQFKFLTPTYFKKNTKSNAPKKSQVIWISDCESNNSSIVTTVANSQQNDPNWTTKMKNNQAEKTSKKIRLRSQTQAIYSSDSDSNSLSVDNLSKKKDPPYKSHRKKPSTVTKRKTRAKVMEDDSNESLHDSPAENTSHLLKRLQQLSPIPVKSAEAKLTKKKKGTKVLESDSNESLHSSLIENQGNLLHRLQQLSPTPVTSVEPNKSSKKKKKVRLLESNSNESLRSSLIENQGNLLDRLRPPTTSEIPAEEDEFHKPLKKRKLGKTVKLFSPSRSMMDFAVTTRHQASALSNDVPLHKGTNTPKVTEKKGKPSSRKTSLKSQKCPQCNEVFKTVISYRRHVFLRHTEPPDDSDSD